MSEFLDRLNAAFARRLSATTPTERHEAEDEIAAILRGRPAVEPFDAKRAQAEGRER
jgi:hypothetical protein